MRQKQTEAHDESKAYSAVQIQSQTELEITAAITEDRTDVTVSRIEDLSSAVRRRKRALSWLSVPAITLSAALIAVRVLLANDVTGIRPVYWALLATFLAGNTGLMALLFTGVTRLNRAVSALSSTDDVRAIGAMAESLSAGEPALSIAGTVLIRLLPHVTREQLEMLTCEQRNALRKGLQSASTRRKYTHYNPVLVIAILQALERFGDKSDIVVVERLASSKAITTEQKSIRTAAEKCLSAITTRSIGETGTRVVWMEAKQNHDSDTSLSSGALEALSTRLRNLARLRRRNVAVTAGSAVVGTGLAFLSMSSFAAGHQLDTVLAAGMLTSLVSMILFALSGTYVQRNLTNALIHSDDLRIVPPLIQAAATVEISGTAAVMLLTRLLPKMRASDANLLVSEDRTLLHTGIAKHGRNSEFVLAALRALQQIGDASSIPTVERLMKKSDRRAADPAVREAARECLAFLQQRAALTEANQMLLRSSSGTATPTDALLRAIDGSAPAASKELLRTSAEPIVYEQPKVEIEQQNTQAFALQPVG